MKQFIVMAAVLPLLMAFLMAFSEDQILSARMAATDDAVYAAKEMARQEGCFTPQIQSWLKKELCRKIKGLDEDDVIVGPDTDTVPVERPGLIHYQFSISMGTRSSGKLLGVRSAGKEYYYIIDSCAASEYLP